MFLQHPNRFYLEDRKSLLQLLIELSQLLLLLKQMLTGFMQRGGPPRHLLILRGEAVQEVQGAADLSLQPACDRLLPLELCLVGQVRLVLLCTQTLLHFVNPLQELLPCVYLGSTQFQLGKGGEKVRIVSTLRLQQKQLKNR